MSAVAGISPKPVSVSKQHSQMTTVFLVVSAVAALSLQCEDGRLSSSFSQLNTVGNILL